MGRGIDAKTVCIQLSNKEQLSNMDQNWEIGKGYGESAGERWGAVLTVTSVPCDWAVVTMQKLLACSGQVQ